MTQYGFFFDMNRCYACQACSIACKDWNGIEPGAEKWMTVYEWEEGTFPLTRLHSLAFSCGHCENPSCIAACENGAIQTTAGRLPKLPTRLIKVGKFKKH